MHYLRSGMHYLLYLHPNGDVAAELPPNHDALVEVQEVPTKLFVYRKLIIPAEEADLHDKNSLTQLTRDDPEAPPT